MSGHKRLQGLAAGALVTVLVFAGCGGSVSGDSGGGGKAGTDAGTGGTPATGGSPGTGGSPSVPCGPNTCAPGETCCNASCGTCTKPGEGCFTLACESCGDTVCAAGEQCCCDECISMDLACPGTCVQECNSKKPCSEGEECCCGMCMPGNGCDLALCAPPPPCGKVDCEYNEVCCDAACGLCADSLGACPDIYCPLECTPQDAIGLGACGAYFGVKWDGSACVGVSGCSCQGADCDALYQSAESCQQAHAGCPILD